MQCIVFYSRCIALHFQLLQLVCFTGKISQNAWVGKIWVFSLIFHELGKKYFIALGNLWKIVSYIWELCGFFNSIDFNSKPAVWEYNSFPHKIPTVWNFTLPILWGLFGFCSNFYIPQNLTAWEWYGFPDNISIIWELVHFQTLGIAWVLINSKSAR